MKRSFSSRLYAVILAGGIGSRFWPLSRETTPKQLLRVVGDESLLVATIRRLSPLVPHERVCIVTNTRQAEVIRDHLLQFKRSLSPWYIIEPLGRNTAPAIGLAALRLVERDPEAIMAILPADHLIKDGTTFRSAIRVGSSVAEEGFLVTFGIVPTGPETGYGYIRTGKGTVKRIDRFSIKRVERFVEKPDIRRARIFLKKGGYYWNSGIFIWKARRILEEIEVHLPGVYRELMNIGRGGDMESAYRKMMDISIDHGVLEKTRGVVVIPVDFGWSDLGSWNSFGEVLRPDERGNVIRGRVVDIGSQDSIIIGSDRVVATIGLRDMIVVDTPDATLVCPRQRAQDVKEVVRILKKEGVGEHEVHRTVERPWGSYTVLEKGQGYKVKKIFLEPGRRLSLQMHRKRSEHWVVISGRARIQRGDEVVEVGVNQSTYIPRGVKHRLENPGPDKLEIIEVQSGEYVEEDDIVRFEDDYDRDRY